MRFATYDTPLERILGEQTVKELKRAFGIVNVRQLLNHAPRRYLEKGELTPLTSLPVGENVTVIAEVESVQERSMQARSGKILEAVITDGLGRVKLTWFNQSWRFNQLKEGKMGLFAGKVGIYQGSYQLSHPDFKMFDTELEALEASDPTISRNSISAPVPIYPATAKLPTWQIEKAVAKVLDSLKDTYDPLPNWVLNSASHGASKLLSEMAAYEAVHRPLTFAHSQAGVKSLRFRESFELQLGLFYRKERVRLTQGVPRAKVAGGCLDKFDAGLPYKLTGDQRRVGETIANELAGGSPMHRLLQGEVGSGKTLVALRAMLQVADMHGQAALLAPTEVLASQHMRSIEELLGAELVEELHPTLLTGQLKAAQKKSAQLAIASGRAKIVVGTHALMSEATTFADLGLIVIDEQHRFGVEQREALRRKGELPPHVLVMTATPIPRTIALTAFGDLEISTLKEMPAGRAEIVSHVVSTVDRPSWLERAWMRAAEEVDRGRQVYVVCPAIHSTDGDGASVEATLNLVRAHSTLGKLRSAELTGEMPSEDKDKTMRAFAAGEIDILIATTVIEVGVNVPNASLMIVLDADRFGVSQLHQLRGRVGRGEHAGLCLFVTGAETDSTAMERVEAVASTLDGFELSQVDLEMRREGDVLGSLQSGGSSSLNWLRVTRDIKIIELSGELARQLIADDRQLKSVPDMRQRFEERENEEQLLQVHKS